MRGCCAVLSTTKVTCVFALFVTLLMVPSLYCVGEDLKLVGHKIKGKLKNLV